MATHTKSTRAAAATAEDIDTKSEKFEQMFSGANKHPVAASIVNIAVTAGGCYLGTQVSMVAAFGAAVLTGSMFISYLVLLLGAIISAIAALRAGAWASKYVACGGFEEDYQRAKAKAMSLFARREANHV